MIFSQRRISNNSTRASEASGIPNELSGELAPDKLVSQEPVPKRDIKTAYFLIWL